MFFFQKARQELVYEVVNKDSVKKASQNGQVTQGTHLHFQCHKHGEASVPSVHYSAAEYGTVWKTRRFGSV